MKPWVVTFHDNNSLARPHHRGTAQGFGVIIQSEGVDQGVLCHLENTLRSHSESETGIVYTISISKSVGFFSVTGIVQQCSYC